MLKNINTYKIEYELVNIEGLNWLQSYKSINERGKYNKSGSEVIKLKNSILRLVFEFYRCDYFFSLYENPEIVRKPSTESAVYEVASLTIYWFYKIMNKVIK
jgi:hypothetical protein